MTRKKYPIFHNFLQILYINLSSNWKINYFAKEGGIIFFSF